MSTTLSSTPESPEAITFSYAEWRMRFLTLILRGASIVGLIVAIVGSIDTAFVLVMIYAISYLTILIVTLVPLPYRVRAISFLVVLMAVAVASMLETGIRVDARLFLLAFVVMATMFFGPRAGVIAGGISLIPIFIIGYFILSGQYTILSVTVLGNTNVMTWVVAVLVMVMIEIIIVTGLTLLQRGFDSALQQSQQLFDVVQAERASLEQRVNERTAQIRTSAEVGRAVTTNLNPDRLLHEVVSLITDRFGYYYAAIFLLDEAGKFAVLRDATGEAGQTLKERGHRLEVGGQSMVGTAAAQRKPRLAANVGEDAVHFNNPLLPETRAEIALPLIVGERLLGVLDVQATRENAFDEASATVLQSMVDQIAIALNNADQYQREQVRLQQTSTLLEATLNLSRLTDQTELQERTIDLALQLLEADGAGLWLPVESDEIELKSTNNTQLIGIAGRRLKIGEGLSGRVFATGTMLRVNDYRTWSGHSESFIDAPIRAALAVPLILHEQVAGVLLVTHSRPDVVFTTEDENVAQLLAAQAATAISMADLLAQQRHTLEELNEANRRLTGEAWVKYMKLLPGGFQRQAYLAQDTAPDSSLSTLPEIDLAMSSRKPSVWTRPDISPATDPHSTGLAAPIVLRGEVLGALQVGEESLAREWTEDEVTFIQAVADQVALALDNARLLEETERRAQRERQVAEVSSRMFASNDLESIIQIAAEELGSLLRVDRAQIMIGATFNEPPASALGEQVT
jgi:GAF domain-containing protein